MKRVGSPISTMPRPVLAYVSGSINGIPCDKLNVDSGCTFTCVAKYLVADNDLTGKYVSLEPFLDQLGIPKTPTAIVKIQIGSLYTSKEVVVCDGLKEDALLGTDLGLTNLAKLDT